MMRLRSFLLLLACTLVPLTASANPVRKLWVAFDQGNAGCKSTLDDFIGCLFDRSNFRALLNSYPGGFDYELGATKLIPGCGLGDYPCVQSQAQFPVSTDDILLHVHAGSACNQAHNERGNTVVFNGKSVSVRTAWVDATICKCQMPFIEHEVYEAANDQASADCCNGQGWLNQQCCNDFGGSGSGCKASIAPDGWYDTMACPNGTYRAQYLAAAPYKADPTKCAKLQVTCPGGGSGKVLHAKCANQSECCQGLTCQRWAYDSTMQPETVCCGAAGMTCSAGVECCGALTCTGGVCTCVAEQAACLNDDDCCAGLLCGASGKCEPKPVPPMDASVPDATSDDGGVVASPDASADGGVDAPVIEVPGCACAQSDAPSAPPGIALIVIAWLSRRRRGR